MPEKIICPRCGTYQANDKTKRKIYAEAKNFGKVFFREASKKFVGELAGSISENIAGGSSSVASKVASGGVGKLFDHWNAMKPQDTNAIKYQCCKCGFNWDGYDRPSDFNEVQRATVKAMQDKEVTGKQAVIFTWAAFTIVSVLFMALSFWIWSNRHTDIETISTWLMGEQQVEHYSWHYYVFWPMVIISGISTLITFFGTIGNYTEYMTTKKIPLDDYAKIKLGL